MSYLINNQQKVNDIIFAGRNKNYGAYAIRSSYGNTLLKSLLFMFSLISTGMLTTYYLCNHTSDESIIGQVMPNEIIHTITPVDLTPKDKTITKHAAASPDKSQPASKQPETKGPVAVVDSTNTEAPHVSDISPVETTAAGNSSGTGISTTPGTENSGTEKNGDDEVKQVYGVDSEPVFEGGLGALYKFIARNVKYPGEAFEDGKEGVSYVQFVVDENGKVGRLHLQNKAGSGFDEEALRVVGMIPNFKTPAKIAGKAVKVYYQLPIRFTLK